MDKVRRTALALLKGQAEDELPQSSGFVKEKAKEACHPTLIDGMQVADFSEVHNGRNLELYCQGSPLLHAKLDLSFALQGSQKSTTE
jgi:hypothetical protein